MFWLAFARRIFHEERPGRIALDYDPMIAGAVAADGPPIDLCPMFDALTPIPTLVVRGALTDFSWSPPSRRCVAASPIWPSLPCPTSVTLRSY